MKISASIRNMIGSLTLLMAVTGTAFADNGLVKRHPSLPPPVPEPASIVVVALGIAAAALLIAYRRTKTAKSAA